MLKRLLRWTGYGLAAVLILLLLAAGVAFAITEWEFAQSYDHVVGEPVAVPEGPEAIERGRRLANLRGCYDGCHGKESAGQIFFEIPDGSRVVAPNLHAVAAEYSDTELERAIRHGIRPDGRSVFGIMPTSMLYHLSDEDLADIIAFLRSRPPDGEPLPETRFGPLLRGMMLLFRSEGFESLAARSVDHNAPRISADRNDPIAYGRYLALTSCVECHGNDLEGTSDGTPNLVVVKAYSLEEFSHLMRTGEPRSGQKLDLMAQVATRRFKQFTDDEVFALHAYLQAR